MSGGRCAALGRNPDDTQAAATELGQDLAEYGLPVTLLVGENWIINSPHAEYVAKKMDGILYLSSSDS